jgi:hypothetical protein
MSKDNEALRELYAGLLTEMRGRRLVLSQILECQRAGVPNRLADFAALELCYLQLRMLCELVALGCLAAHGDIPDARTSRLLNEYKADVILNALEKLHHEFYPIPFRQVPPPPGTDINAIEDINDNYLTKPDLLKLYYECGNHLHRGSTSRISPLTSFDFQRINGWHDKMLTLLKSHRIRLIDQDFELWCLLNHDNTGRAQVNLMEGVSAPSVSSD